MALSGSDLTGKTVLITGRFVKNKFSVHRSAHLIHNP